jgi:hypothetical protein
MALLAFLLLLGGFPRLFRQEESKAYVFSFSVEPAFPDF